MSANPKIPNHHGKAMAWDSNTKSYVCLACGDAFSFDAFGKRLKSPVEIENEIAFNAYKARGGYMGKRAFSERIKEIDRENKALSPSNAARNLLRFARGAFA